MIDLSRSRWLNNWNNSSNWICIKYLLKWCSFNVRHEKVFHVLIFYVRLVPAQQISHMCQLFIILRYETKFYDWHFSLFIVFAIDVILYAYEESTLPFQDTDRFDLPPPYAGSMHGSQVVRANDSGLHIYRFWPRYITGNERAELETWI
jgi:hypothetical protein